MSRRQLLNLLLLIVLLALGLLAWLRPGLEPPPAEQLTSLASLDIKHITLHSKRATIHFERQGEGWMITDPPPMPADSLQVQRLAELTEARVQRSYPAAELEPAKLGLSDSSPRIELNDQAFLIGDTDPLSHLRYLQQGDHIYLIDDSLANFLDAGRTQFASRKLLPEGARVTLLQLPDLILHQTPDGRWQAEPNAPAASADDWNQLAQYWEHAQAIWVGKLKEQAEWPQQISIGLKDGTNLQYLLRSDSDDLILGRKDWGLEYHLGSAARDQLLKPPAHDEPEATDQP